jgi:hypothetical protein
MKQLTVEALLAGHFLTVAQLVLAADLAETEQPRMGAFGGVRVRVPLGGDARQRQVRAGLTIAPTLHSRSLNGAARTRIGEGLELGVTGREPVRLSVAGTPVNRLVQGGTGPDGQRLGVSTVGWIAIGTGVVVLAIGGFYWWVMEESECGPGDC